MRTKKKLAQIEFYLIILIMMFWDIAEEYIPNSQFIVISLILFVTIIYRKKIHINLTFIILFLFVILHGIFCELQNYGSIKLLVKQVLGISISYITFDNIIKENEIDTIWTIYFNSCFIMCIIGIFIQTINIINNTFYYRMSSLCSEPSFLCYFLVPIVSAIILDKFYNNKVFKNVQIYKIKSIIILFCYCMTFSTIAFLGLILIFIFGYLSRGLEAKKIISLIVIILFGICIYRFVPDIKMRIDDTLNISKTKDVFDLNLSTYTLYNNIQITKNVIIETKGIGCGLGSYQMMFDKYSLNRDQIYPTIYSLNREDANSMFLRLLSELGIAGILIVLFWIFKHYVKGRSKLSIYSKSIMILFILFLLRQGNYVHCCSMLYICLYKKISKIEDFNRKVL